MMLIRRHVGCADDGLDFDRAAGGFHRLVVAPRPALYRDGDRTAVIHITATARGLDYDAAGASAGAATGGSEPAHRLSCAGIGAGWGYDEINLNVGCPSDRGSRAVSARC